MTYSGTSVYPGIYKAYCVSRVNPYTVSAYVAQVFGQTEIKITQWTGIMPSPGDSGYVSFEGGDASFPVWHSFAGGQGAQGPQGASGASEGYYGAFHDKNTQTAAAVDTAYAMNLRTIDASNGFSIASNTRITAAYKGIYNIQFSAQISKSGGSAAYTHIWLRKNGSDLPETNSRVAVQGTTAETVPAWNWVLSLESNDYVEIMWSVSNTNIVLLATSASSLYPAIPSVIATVHEIAHTLQGPQGPQGIMGGTYNIDGGDPTSLYGGILPLDAGGI